MKMQVRSGRYNDGGQSYQRVTTFLKNLETTADTYHLDEWKANTLAVGLAGRPDLVMGVRAADQRGPDGKLTKEAKQVLWGLRKQAMEAGRASAGATVGTAVHTATERLDRGETVSAIGLPYPYNADLNAYAVLKKAMGINCPVDLMERTVRLQQWGIAGTFDRFGTCTLLEEMGVLAPGELVVIDVKTEQDPTRNLLKIGAQLACYANADDLFVDSENGIGEFVPLPAVNKAVGLVIHLRDGVATPIPVDLTKGWRAATRAYEQREDSADAKSGSWTFHIPVKLPAGTELVQRQALPELSAARERTAGLIDQTFAVGDTVAVGGLEFTKHSELPGVDPGEVAVRRADGLVEFVPAPAGAPAAEPLVTADSAAFAIEAIGTAATMQDLADLYDRITGAGVSWTGEVERAGQWRAGIIECPQRELHNGGGRCACGWREGLQS